ncbi:MAG: ABC transporter ATP-binding protein/permease [Vicinamibacteria bacterium]|nr:ABC transporter ATP-binding protein/permease [Vicinamibacteria bacterium]
MPRRQREPLGRGARLRALAPVLWSLARPRWRLLVLGFALMALDRGAGLVLPLATRALVDDVLLARRPVLTPILLSVVTAAVLKAVATWGIVRTITEASQQLVTELRERVQEHVLRLPLGYFDRNHTGALVSRVLSDPDGVRNLVGTGVIYMAGGLMATVFALALMLHINMALTGLAALFVAIVLLSMRRTFGSLSPLFTEQRRLLAEVSGRLTESLAGIRVLKAYQREAEEARSFASAVRRLLALSLRVGRASMALSVLGNLSMDLVAAAVMLVGARLILSGELSLGELLAYGVLVGLLVPPLLRAAAVGVQILDALVSLERLREILDEPGEHDDTRRALILPDVRGEVTFERVSFAYDGVSDVLHDLSFDAGPGTITALVGPSGAGKSTIASLVAAFREPRTGRVLVDGVDLARVRLDSYRRHLGVVLQETFLFSGTIRENVALARPEASEAELLRACRLANVDEFAEDFPAGYETVVGERGIRLSGGQQQRVAIARAILANPRIVILDEATSSLDARSERFIQNGLARLLEGRTVFVIAHRLSTIRRAGQILVLDRGRIVERGRHEELLARGGRYFELYAQQVPGGLDSPTAAGGAG